MKDAVFRDIEPQSVALRKHVMSALAESNQLMLCKF
jgi:hypothetical protein